MLETTETVEREREREEALTDKEDKGITLIALVVTVIVLLILAGVSIGLVFDANGLFSKANDAATKWNNAKNDEAAYLGSVMNELDKYNGIYGGGTPFGEPDNTKKKAPDGDWWIPKGFEESPESSPTIKGGKVIQDEAGNEWVWVPCYLEDNGIKIGQQQYSQATEYKRTAFEEEDIITRYTESLDSNDKASIKKFGGYYIGRYEAGSEIEVSEEDSTRKVLIQKNKNPYNYITIGDSITKSNSFTKDNNYYEDKVYTKLVSSYAWDTALEFIQKTVPDYATISGPINYENTGLSAPVCNIYNMGENLDEYSSESYNDEDFPYIVRGGGWEDCCGPAGTRNYGVDGNAYSFSTFRLTLYLK